MPTKIVPIEFKQQDDGQFLAADSSLEIPDCMRYGKSKDEARESLRVFMRRVVRDLLAAGTQVPGLIDDGRSDVAIIFHDEAGSLQIAFSSDLHPASQDFGMKVQDGKLLVPEELRNILFVLDVRDAAELFCYILTYPSMFIDGLGWSLRDVQVATRALAELLEGHVEDSVLHPGLAVKFPRGAFDPARLPAQNETWFARFLNSRRAMVITFIVLFLLGILMAFLSDGTTFAQYIYSLF